MESILQAPAATLIMIITLSVSYYALDPQLRLLRGPGEDVWLILRYLFWGLIIAARYIVMWVSAFVMWAFRINRHFPLIDQMALEPGNVIFRKEYYRVLTHGLIHGGYIHLLINMFVFLSFGFLFERVVGTLSFVVIYFGSMILSGAISAYRRRHLYAFRSVGASGAISGIIFGFILYFPNSELLLFFILPTPALAAALIFIVGSYYAAKKNFLPGIDHEGHIWGALSGAALTILLQPQVLQLFWSRINSTMM